MVEKNVFGDVISDDISVVDTPAADTPAADTSAADTSISNDEKGVNEITQTNHDDVSDAQPIFNSIRVNSSVDVDDVTNVSSTSVSAEEDKQDVSSGPMDSSDLDKSSSEETPVLDHAERNFKAIRESKRQLEADLAAQAKKIQQYEAAIAKYKEPELIEDVTVENTSAGDSNSNQLAQMQQMYAQTQAMQVEIQLKNKYSDFDKVVSADNVDVLKSLYPKVAYEIINEKDIYTKAEKAYEAVKKYNIFTDDASAGSTMSNKIKKDRVTKNISKPRPSSAARPGSPALGAANAFAEDSSAARRNTFEEMKRLARGE